MRLLLDSHVGEALASQLRARGIDATTLAEWQDGRYRTAQDEDILQATHADRRMLVTFDCHTIPPLLKELAETGQHHSGVIFVSSRTFRANDVGGLLHALVALARDRGDAGWEDVALFLR